MKTYFETKFKESEIGKIPVDWGVKEIQEIGEIKTGTTPPTKNKEFWVRDIDFLTPTDIKNFDIKYGYEVQRKISNSFFIKYKNKFIPKNSICFVSIGSTIGKICMVKNLTLTNQQINSIIPNKNNEGNFIFYFLMLEKFNIKNKFVGGAVKGILKKSVFEKLKIPLPPTLTEQKNISKMLSDLDDKIEINKKINRNLEEIGKNIFKRWFIDFEFEDEKGKSYKSNSGKMIFSPELEKEIPEGWEIKTLDKFFEEIKEINSENFPQYTIGKMGIKKIKKINHQIDKHKIFLKNDLIVGIGVEEINFNLNIKNGSCSPIYNVFRLKNNLGYIFMFYYSKFILKNYKNKFTKSLTRRKYEIIKKDLIKLEIYFPPNKILKKFSNIIKPIFEKLLENSKETQKLQELRDYLLPKLMKGEIRVKN